MMGLKTAYLESWKTIQIFNLHTYYCNGSPEVLAYVPDWQKLQFAEENNPKTTKSHKRCRPIGSKEIHCMIQITEWYHIDCQWKQPSPLAYFPGWQRVQFKLDYTPDSDWIVRSLVRTNTQKHNLKSACSTSLREEIRHLTSSGKQKQLTNARERSINICLVTVELGSTNENQ